MTIHSQKQPLKFEIKIPVVTDFTGINYFKQKYGGQKIKAPTSSEIVKTFSQDFKNLAEPMKLKILFHYIRDRTKDGLYKKEDNRTIGNNLGGVNKETINTRIKKLVDLGYLKKLSELDLFKELKERDKYYKLLKEDFKDE